MDRRDFLKILNSSAEEKAEDMTINATIEPELATKEVTIEELPIQEDATIEFPIQEELELETSPIKEELELLETTPIKEPGIPAPAIPEIIIPETVIPEAAIPEVVIIEPPKIKPEKYRPIRENLDIKKDEWKQLDEWNEEDKIKSNKQPEWKEATEAAKTVSVELSQDELDRLSMSLSEQSKEELTKTIRALNITNVRIELDQRATRIMTNIVNKCKELNIDWFIAIVGMEGVGKSTLALNLFSLVCKLNGLNPIEILLRTLIYDEDELLRFIASVDPREKFLALDLDEGANVLFNRESMQIKRNYILKFFNVMRFLNAIVFIPTPNIKFLDKNVKAHRIKSIFYIPSRGIYWFYDKDQVDRMLANETQKKWYWVEPKAVGSFGINKELESIVNLIKENYVRMFSEKVKDFLNTEDKRKKKIEAL